MLVINLIGYILLAGLVFDIIRRNNLKQSIRSSYIILLFGLLVTMIGYVFRLVGYSSTEMSTLFAISGLFRMTGVGSLINGYRIMYNRGNAHAFNLRN